MYDTNHKVDGKYDISNNTMDALLFQFIDKYGVSMPSLGNFLITLVVDEMWLAATSVDD